MQVPFTRSTNPASASISPRRLLSYPILLGAAALVACSPVAEDSSVADQSAQTATVVSCNSMSDSQCPSGMGCNVATLTCVPAEALTYVPVTPEGSTGGDDLHPLVAQAHPSGEANDAIMQAIYAAGSDGNAQRRAYVGMVGTFARPALEADLAAIAATLASLQREAPTSEAFTTRLDNAITLWTKLKAVDELLQRVAASVEPLQTFMGTNNTLEALQACKDTIQGSTLGQEDLVTRWVAAHFVKTVGSCANAYAALLPHLVALNKYEQVEPAMLRNMMERTAIAKRASEQGLPADATGDADRNLVNSLPEDVMTAYTLVLRPWLAQQALYPILRTQVAWESSTTPRPSTVAGREIVVYHESNAADFSISSELGQWLAVLRDDPGDRLPVQLADGDRRLLARNLITEVLRVRQDLVQKLIRDFTDGTYPLDQVQPLAMVAESSGLMGLYGGTNPDGSSVGYQGVHNLLKSELNAPGILPDVGLVAATAGCVGLSLGTMAAPVLMLPAIATCGVATGEGLYEAHRYAVFAQVAHSLAYTVAEDSLLPVGEAVRLNQAAGFTAAMAAIDVVTTPFDVVDALTVTARISSIADELVQAGTKVDNLIARTASAFSRVVDAGRSVQGLTAEGLRRLASIDFARIRAGLLNPRFGIVAYPVDLRLGPAPASMEEAIAQVIEAAHKGTILGFDKGYDFKFLQTWVRILLGQTIHQELRLQGFTTPPWGTHWTTAIDEHVVRNGTGVAPLTPIWSPADLQTTLNTPGGLHLVTALRDKYDEVRDMLRIGADRIAGLRGGTEAEKTRLVNSMRTRAQELERAALPLREALDGYHDSYHWLVSRRASRMQAFHEWARIVQNKVARGWDNAQRQQIIDSEFRSVQGLQLIWGYTRGADATAAIDDAAAVDNLLTNVRKVVPDQYLSSWDIQGGQIATNPELQRAVDDLIQALTALDVPARNSNTMKFLDSLFGNGQLPEFKQHILREIRAARESLVRVSVAVAAAYDDPSLDDARRFGRLYWGPDAAKREHSAVVRRVERWYNNLNLLAAYVESAQ